MNLFDEFFETMRNMNNQFQRGMEVMDDRNIHLLEYLSDCGENCYITRIPSMGVSNIVFPNGIRSEKFYNKLTRTARLKIDKDKHLELILYPSNESHMAILSSIIFSL